jgi:hypothetical protein
MSQVKSFKATEYLFGKQQPRDWQATADFLHILPGHPLHFHGDQAACKGCVAGRAKHGTPE